MCYDDFNKVEKGDEVTMVVESAHKLRRSFILCILIVLVLLFSSRAWAGIAVYPSKVEIKTDKGKSEEIEINVVNNKNKRAYISTVKMWDFARDENGVAHPVKPEDAKTFQGCSKWIDLVGGKKKTIDPDQTGTFKFKVKVPDDAEYGTHYCYFTFSNAPVYTKEEEKQGISLPMVYRISALILVTVGGSQDSDEPPTLKQATVIDDFEVSKLNFSDTVSMDARIRNTGNVHMNLQKGSKIEIWKGKRKTATIPVQEFTLLPKNTLVVPTTWKAGSPFGKYRAKFYGYIGLDKPLTAEGTFWVVSWKLLMTVISAIALLAIGLRLFFKRYRIQLASKEPKAPDSEASKEKLNN